MKINKNQIAVCIGIAVLLIASAGCGTKSKVTPYESIVTCTMGKVTLARGSSSRDVALKDKIESGDRVTTGKNSFVIIQTADDKILRIESDTTLLFDTITEGNTILTLDRGTILSKINKLRKNENYSVKTPIALAAVRGTQFMTSYNGATAVVSVKEGKVEISPNDKSEVKAIDPGKSAVVMKTVVLRDATSREKSVLDSFSSIELIEDINAKSGAELGEVGKKILESGKDNREPMVFPTLADIRTQYGRIDVLTLYSGQVIKGAIISRSETIKIITPEGFATIDPMKIKRTETE